MSFLDKIKNRVEKVAADGLTKAGIPVSNPEVQKNRIEICNACEHLFKLTRSCKKCGCFVDAKTRLENEHCPIKKW